jgi:hypothetical protein
MANNYLQLIIFVGKILKVLSNLKIENKYKIYGHFFSLFSYNSDNLIFIHMFKRYVSADKHTGTMEPGLIPVLHYVAEAKALVESDRVEKKDDPDGIFQIQDRLEEEVDPLTSTSSSYLHPQLEVKMTQETYG